jgi:hypothetical protein
MRTFFLVSVILGLLLYSVSGLLHLKFLPHDHLLLGFVTPEQLRAHEAAEAQDMQGMRVASASPTPSSDVTITPTGGLILSLAPGLSGLILVSYLEIALQLALLLFAPLVYHAISISRLLLQTITLASPDPPPRALLAPR